MQVPPRKGRRASSKCTLGQRGGRIRDGTPIAAEVIVDEAAAPLDQLNVAGLNVCGDYLRDFLRELVDGRVCRSVFMALLNSAACGGSAGLR